MCKDNIFKEHGIYYKREVDSGAVIDTPLTDQELSEKGLLNDPPESVNTRNITDDINSISDIDSANNTLGSSSFEGLLESVKHEDEEDTSILNIIPGMNKEYAIVDNKKVCPVCFGTGFWFPPNGTHPIACPKCKNALNNTVTAVEPDEEELPILEKLMIPHNYWGKPLNMSKIEDRVIGNDEILDSSIYIRKLREVYSEISLGNVYQNSLLIYAPQGYGKDEFVFTSMQMALKKKMTTVPYVDTKEFDHILHSTTYQNSAKFESPLAKFTSDDFILADYCFIKIAMASVNLKRDLQILEMLVDERARKGKPTIILSTYNLRYLQQVEKTFDRFIVSEADKYSYATPIYTPLQVNYSYGNKQNYNNNKQNYNKQSYNTGYNRGGYTNKAR